MFSDFKSKYSSAFSIIEVIVALGIFSIIIGSGVLGLIPALRSSAKGSLFFQKKQLVEEGLEAVRSIRQKDWSNITPGTFGLGLGSSGWLFSGTGDTLGGLYRQINISAVNRDTNGTIVDTGGTPDPDSFLATSIVANFSQSALLTNWHRPIGVNFDGLIVYGDGSTLPKFRTYQNGTTAFGGESGVLPQINGYNFALKTSPSEDEAVLAVGSPTGQLSVFCFDGSTWTLDWTATIGGTATTRRFDLTYETNSGDVLVAYGNNSSGTNEISYRTKTSADGCGPANWSAVSNFDPVRTTGTVYWLKFTSDRRGSSNLAAILWADSNSDLSAAIWNGSSFTNEPSVVSESSLEIVSTAADVEDFDLEYESLSGDLMMIWANSAGSNGTNGVRYRLCPGGTATCTWSAVTTPPTFADDATNLDLAANPASDEMVFASIGNAGNDLQAGYWNGLAWTNRANLDNNCAAPIAGGKNVAVAWLNNGTTKRSILVYDDSNGTAIDWYVGSSGTFTAQTDKTVSPVFATTIRWMNIFPDPKNSNQLILVLADSNNDLFAKHLSMTSTPVFTWSNTEGGSALETSLPSPLRSPFIFSYWQK